MIVYHITEAKWAIENIRLKRIKIAELNDLNDPFELLATSSTNKKERKEIKEWKEEVAKNTTKRKILEKIKNDFFIFYSL